MSLLGTLIGGAVSLIGANKQAKAQKEANYQNSPQGIRANSEAAGFNPLVFAGPGTITQYAPQMGNALMDIGGLIQDGLTEEEKLKLQKAELEQENQRLSKQSAKARLRPTVPGVYAQGGISPRSKGRMAEQGPVIEDYTTDVSYNRTEGGQVRPVPRLTFQNMGTDERVWNVEPGENVRMMGEDGKRKWYRVEDENIVVRNQTTGGVFGYVNPDLTEGSPAEMGTGLAALNAAEHGLDPILTAPRLTKKERQKTDKRVKSLIGGEARIEREKNKRKEKKLPLYLQRLQ